MSASPAGGVRHCAEHDVQWAGDGGCWVCGKDGEPGRPPGAHFDGGMTWRPGDVAWQPVGRER